MNIVTEYTHTCVLEKWPPRMEGADIIIKIYVIIIIIIIIFAPLSLLCCRELRNNRNQEIFSCSSKTI